jgi:serine/threonine protein kinase
MMDRPQIPSREEVKALCERNGPRSNGLAYGNDIWIKYGTGTTLAEAAIQRFVHENADRSLVHTPAVYDSFTVSADTYIVMEKVEGEAYVDYKKQHPDKAETVLQAVADAIRHVWSLPLPPNASPGPFEGQIPEDRFFSDYSAGRTFENIAQLENWINDKLIYRNKPERVSFQYEKLQLCHNDLTQWNVMVDKPGKPPIIIDWGFSGIYPRAFEEYALVQQFSLPGSRFAKDLHKQLFGPKLSTNMRPLSLVAAMNAFGPFCV